MAVRRIVTLNSKMFTILYGYYFVNIVNIFSLDVYNVYNFYAQ